QQHVRAIFLVVNLVGELPLAHHFSLCDVATLRGQNLLHAFAEAHHVIVGRVRVDDEDHFISSFIRQNSTSYLGAPSSLERRTCPPSAFGGELRRQNIHSSLCSLPFALCSLYSDIVLLMPFRTSVRNACAAWSWSSSNVLF